MSTLSEATLKNSSKIVSASLQLEDGSSYKGYSFGYPHSIAGEVVFNTGMVGYPESLTDPSYRGQILILTYPLIGNYGICPPDSPDNLSDYFESKKIQASALVVSDYSPHFRHWRAERSLADWLKEHQVPGITGIDTRSLTKKIREKGAMLGKIVVANQEVPYYDPNEENLVAQVSITEPELHGQGDHRIIMLDCGSKHNIIRSLLRYNVEVLLVPWDHDISNEKYDGLVISNGPGNPKMCQPTINSVANSIKKRIPTLGICMGHQILSLAIGADTYKMKYGHRSQNQPVLEVGSRNCFVTSQNHGYAVDLQTIPAGWKTWYVNLNDNTSEGLIHDSGRFMSVQFHPEACPGPVDTDFIFDRFMKLVKAER